MSKMVQRDMEELKFDKLKSVVEDETIEISTLVQFGQLMYRNKVGLSRNPAALIGRIVISIFVSITSLGIFWNNGGKLQDATESLDIVQVRMNAFGLASSIFFMCIA